MARWSPKQWTRPRSRAWRDARDPVTSLLSAKETSKILKRLYASGPTPPTPVMDRPWWAHLALKQGWITRGAYLAVKERPTGRMHPARPGLTEAVYSRFPLFGMTAKKTDWTPTEAAQVNPDS